MTYKSMLKMVLLAFSLMLAFSFGTSAQKPDCSKTTDDQLVDSIYAKIKAKYEGQMKHINVRISGGVVTLEGWATTKGVKKDIEKLAKKTGCVKSVVSNLTIGVGGGCGPGTKPCGDTCIGSSERCNIRGD